MPTTQMNVWIDLELDGVNSDEVAAAAKRMDADLLVTSDANLLVY